MVRMRVSLVELPFQIVRVGSCNHVLSHQIISATIPRGPNVSRAYPITEACGWGDGKPRSLPSQDR
jgi:hypothetical protein